MKIKTNFFRKTSLIKKTKNKKGVAIEELVWWIIGIAVLAIMVVLSILLKDKLLNAGEYIKNLFRFR